VDCGHTDYLIRPIPFSVLLAGRYQLANKRTAFSMATVYHPKEAYTFQLSGTQHNDFGEMAQEFSRRILLRRHPFSADSCHWWVCPSSRSIARPQSDIGNFASGLNDSGPDNPRSKVHFGGERIASI